VATDKKLVFIVSGGRTGTAFFGERLREVIADCHSVHEPDLFVGFNRLSFSRIRQFGWWHVVFGKLLGRTGLRTIGTRYLMGRLSAQDCQERLATFRQRYHASLEASLVIESSAQWWYVVDQIPNVWPDARIIAVIRDPRAWVRSWLNKGDRYVSRDRAARVPPGRLTPRKLGDAEWSRRWHELDAFGKLAWEWRTVYGRLEQHVAHYCNGRMYRFEDIFGQDDSTLADLVTFAASHGASECAISPLAGFRDEVRNASEGSEPEWQQWSAERARLLDELCGPLMQQYGYGHEAQWKELLARQA